MATPAEQRPAITHDVHTGELPALPQRDRRIPADRWIEAPEALVALGADIGSGTAGYIRRIGRFLLWRAGAAVGEDSRYMALCAQDLSERYTFRLYADGTGEGDGPDGVSYGRFRSWKESLRDSRGTGPGTSSADR